MRSHVFVGYNNFALSIVYENFKPTSTCLKELIPCSYSAYFKETGLQTLFLVILSGLLLGGFLRTFRVQAHS